MHNILVVNLNSVKL